MNCCDEFGNCNQGRNCPIRPAKVAKVKRTVPRYQAQQRQGECLRRNMRHLAKWMLIAIGVMFGTVIAGALVVGGNLLAGVLA